MSNLNRRDFLKAAGIAGTTTAVACDYRAFTETLVPTEHVLPYVVQPEQSVPGLSTWFATRCNECPAGCGVLARNREGRVVKLEGNPDHPVNKGALCARGQAGILGTYSPDRFTSPMDGGKAIEWAPALDKVAASIKAAQTAGKRVAWLGRYRTGGTAALIRQLVKAAGGSVVMWEAYGDDALMAATLATFGIAGIPAYVLDEAHVIVSFGAEVLGAWGSPAHARGYANSRDPEHGGFVSRLVTVMPRVGSTAALADLHLSAKPGTEAGLAMALAKLVAQKKGYRGPAAKLVAGVDADALIAAADVSKERVQELVGWLAAHPSVILPGGPATSAAATALATATLLLNEVAGNIGRSVHFGAAPNAAGRSSWGEAVDLLKASAAGQVGVLFLDDVDPVYAIPTSADLDPAKALAQADLLVAFSNEPSDSLTASALVLPPGSTLESWGDGEETVGLHTLQQPAMVPLHDTRAIGDILLSVAAAAGLASAAAAATPAADAAAAKVEGSDAAPAPETLVVPGLDSPDFRTWLMGWWKAVVWDAAGRPGSFDSFWISCLQVGGWFGQRPKVGATVQLKQSPDTGARTPSGGMSLALFAHPFLVDGRHANKPWAQEIPEPLSTYTWTTWVEVHPDTAAQLGLEDRDLVSVKTDKGEIKVDWYPSPGIRKDTVAVGMGNGHTAGGRYARFGANPIQLLGLELDEGGSPRLLSKGATVARTGEKSGNKRYITTQDQQDRGVNHAVSADDLGKGKEPGSIVPQHEVPVDPRLIAAGITDMYPEPNHPTYRFAMAVDLNRCTGCGACETACYAENNLPIVGPDQIAKSRHMGWIRLSRYWEGEGDHPDVRFQPVMCQQCSHAPCEGVCPVLATYHNLDGLNAMVYNRCVGTRYCGNNCPYSARRFNYHTFQWPESFHMMLNPDVVVREMGVMEKCTFCVQRIRDVKDHYRDDNHAHVPSSALVKLTACAQACPADAITFGNTNDAEGPVSKLFENERAYIMLGELNTKPGVRYLARINHTPSELGAHHGGAGHPEGASAHGEAAPTEHGDHHPEAGSAS